MKLIVSLQTLYIFVSSVNFTASKFTHHSVFRNE
jgi:hypothetical protein